MLIQHFIDAIPQRRRCVMTGLSFPAPSLSDRPASLRALPDRSPTSFLKRLICMVLPVIARAVCGLRSNFLPELREALQRGRRLDAGRYDDSSAAGEPPDRRGGLRSPLHKNPVAARPRRSDSVYGRETSPTGMIPFARAGRGGITSGALGEFRRPRFSRSRSHC